MKLKVPIPEKYGGGGDKLEDFIWAYDNYVHYKGIEPKESGQLISFYLTEQALKEYKSMTTEEQTDLPAIYKRLRNRFRSAGFKMTQQGKLMNATQRDEEGIDEYIERFERIADSIDTDPKQKLTLFIRNTKKEIREDLITFGAESAQEAYNRARLKEASMMEREEKVQEETKIE